VNHPRRPTSHEPVVAATEALDALGRMLARGFGDDPVWRHLVPDDRRWRHRMDGVFAAMIRRSTVAGTTWTTSSREGAAVWAAPGEWRTPWTDVARSLPALLRGFGARGAPRALRVLSTLESGHPEEPHWYLEFLATEPDLRGKGLGSALITPVLDRCDHEGRPAYLESSKRENLAFYGRFGFEVTEELPVEPGGPHIWRMWRDPR
jgi:GNAT superfamily N-acetyltransferase